MPSTEFRRQLAAIMFSDIVGYSKMMDENEERTLGLLEEHNAIVVSAIEEHGGKVLKFIGDAVVAMFETASSAVLAASDIQLRLARRNASLEPDRRIVIRIGIHVGEVSMKEGDVFGNGVNIAARLEPLADHGGICVSEAVHDMLRGHKSIRLEPMGKKRLKNIQGEIELYRVLLGGRPAAPPSLAEAIPGPGGAPAWAYGLMGLAIAVSAVVVLHKMPGPSAPGPSAARPGFVILVSRLYADDPRARRRADELRDAILQDLNRELGGIESVRITPVDDAEPPRTHDQARAFGRAKGGNVVIWGSASVEDGTVRIEPYVTVARGSGDVKAAAAAPLEAPLELSGEFSPRGEAADQVGDLALMTAGQYFLSRDPARAYDLLSSIKNPTPDSLTALAHIAAGQEKWSDAEDFLKKALAQEPSKGTALSYLGYIQFEQDRFDEALQTELKAKKLDPSSVWPSITLSRIYAGRGRPEDAAAELRRALDASPDSGWPRFDLGQLDLEAGRVDDAVRELKEAAARLPEVSSITLLLYVALRKQGQTEEAKKVLSDALSRFAQNKFWATTILEFYAGRQPASELLEATAERSAYKRCRTRYFVALEDLWEGKRNEGRDMMEDLVKTCRKEWFYQRAAKRELAGLLKSK